MSTPPPDSDGSNRHPPPGAVPGDLTKPKKATAYVPRGAGSAKQPAEPGSAPAASSDTPAAGGGAPATGRTGVLKPGGTMGPGGKPARGTQVNLDREALGLSSARPSEMIAGLEEAAKRAEK